MRTRTKVWLAYPALIVVVLSLINFGMFFANQAAPVPLLVSHPIGMVASAYLVFGFVLPAMFGLHGRRRVLPPPGPVIATGRTDGKVGRMSFTGRLIKVAVYPDRLTLGAFRMGDYTVHGSEIRSVAVEGDGWRRRIVIEHTGPGQASPVVLASLPFEVHQAIEQIRRDPLPALAEPSEAEDPAERAARGIAWGFYTITYIGGIVFGLGIAGFAVIQLVRGSAPLFAIMAVFGLVSVFQCARELVKHSRQD